MFGLLSRAMRWVDCLSDPADICESLVRTRFEKVPRGFLITIGSVRKVTYLCSKIDFQAWLGSATVVVEELKTTRNWKQWFFGLNAANKSLHPKLLAIQGLRKFL